MGYTDRDTNSGALDGTGGGTGPKRRRQQAGFSVFLDQVVEGGEVRWETRLYHAESGAETTLPGAAAEQWIAWIVDRMQQVGTAGMPLEATSGRSAVEVASVEILDVTMVGDDAGGTGSLRTIRAQLVVQLTGVAGLEREIGSRVLRGIATPGPRSSSTTPPERAT